MSGTFSSNHSPSDLKIPNQPELGVSIASPLVSELIVEEASLKVRSLEKM